MGAEAGWAAAAQPAAAAATPEELVHVVRGRLNVGDAMMHGGHYQRARELLDSGLELALANQFERIEPSLRATLVRLDWLAGAWDRLDERVAALAEGAHAAVPTPARSEDVWLVAGLFAAARGDPERAEAALRMALAGDRRHGWVMHELAPAAGLATLRLAAGEVAAALAVTDRPIATLMSKQIWVWATDIAPVRVAALLAASRADQAEQLAGRLKTEAARSRPDLLAPRVAAGLAAWAEAPDEVLVAEIDPTLADTAAFCEAYDIGLEISANCVVVVGKRGGETGTRRA